MKQITYKSDSGAIVVFGDTPPMLLEYIDTMSVGSVVDENMLIGGRYRTYVTGFDRRVIPVDVAIAQPKWLSSKDYITLKRKMINALNLSHQGTLIYEDETGSYSIRVRPLSIPTEEDLIGNNGRFSIQFETTESPLWKSSNEITRPIGQIMGGVSFPLVFEDDIEFGEMVNDIVILNDSSYRVPFKILVLGKAPTLTITNQTSGQYLQFNREILDSQEIEIDTETQTAVVKNAVTGEFLFNANQYLTLDSEYFQLEVGRNEINVDNGTGGQTAFGFIFYNKLYGGL